MSIMTIGIDLAKNIFTVHGVDENGKAVLIKPNTAIGDEHGNRGRNPIGTE